MLLTQPKTQTLRHTSHVMPASHRFSPRAMPRAAAAAQTEPLLRDMAYVLHLTRQVKREILNEATMQ